MVGIQSFPIGARPIFQGPCKSSRNQPPSSWEVPIHWTRSPEVVLVPKLSSDTRGEFGVLLAGFGFRGSKMSSHEGVWMSRISISSLSGWHRTITIVRFNWFDLISYIFLDFQGRNKTFTPQKTSNWIQANVKKNTIFPKSRDQSGSDGVPTQTSTRWRHSKRTCVVTGTKLVKDDQNH